MLKALGASPSAQQDKALVDRMSMIRVYSFVAMLALLVFGALHILEGSTITGIAEEAAAVALMLNLIGLKMTANQAIARVGFLLTMLAVVITLLATGGTEGTGVFWVFLFPVAAFFLSGRRAGILWMIGLAVVILTMRVLAFFDLSALYYTDIELRQLIVSLTVVTVGIYVYERVRESSERKIHEVDLAKSEFVTIASHQLRTPISAINWFAEMLKAGDAGDLKEEQQEYVDKIYQSNQRMAELVDAMLTVSSLELKSLPIRPEPLDIADVARKVVKAQLAGTTKKLEFKEHYDQSLPKVTYDPQILKLILQNLASNAIKYTPEKGYISLEIARSGEKTTRHSSGSVAIILSDNGYGIPKKSYDKIFTKFFRGENIKSKDTDGTGLGLYVVKALLDYTGGRVTFDSHEGKGTTFVVLLPNEPVIKPPSE